MPASLTGRIVGAFAVLAVVLWLALGAVMFVALRGLHSEATSSGLADIAQTFAVRLRGAVVDREVRTVIAQVRNEVAESDVTIHLLSADGSVVDVGPGDPSPTNPIPIAPTTRSAIPSRAAPHGVTARSTRTPPSSCAGRTARCHGRCSCRSWTVPRPPRCAMSAGPCRSSSS